jgi:TRAP transporter TAXI family solute receptor
MSFGTAGTGGIYYPLGGAIASRLSLADSNHQFTAEVTGGSVENVNRVANGEMDLGLSMMTTIHRAYNGGPDFPEPLSRLRLVAPVYPNRVHIVAARNSPVQSVSELRGRRVAVGSPGSGTEQVAREVLAAYDLTYDDIDVRYLSFRESSDALRDRAVDAAFFAAGYPVSAVLEVMTSRAARLLPIDREHQRILTERFQYYRDGVIPSEAYPGVEEDVSTITVMNWIVGRDDLDPSVVRLMLDLLRNNRADLEQVHEIARQIDLDVLLESTSIPFHTETERWVGEVLRE